jgi:Mg-chelatase subunit ChlD
MRIGEENVSPSRTVACLAVAACLAPGTPPERSTAADAHHLDDLVIVTEDRAVLTDGCDAVSVFRSDTGAAVFRGATHVSPGRLTATSDLRVVIASPPNSAVQVADGSWTELLYLAGSSDSTLTHWSSGIVLGTDTATLGGIAVLPGDKEFLVATSEKTFNFATSYLLLKNRPPFFVRKYAVPNRIVPEQHIGQSLGAAPVDELVVEILLSPDARHAYLLSDQGTVYTLDFRTMQLVGFPIELAPFQGRANTYFGAAIDRMHATLSADGRYLLANRGDSNEIRVADLSGGTAWVLGTSSDVESIGGLALDWRGQNSGLLAVHANNKVVVYRWAPHGPLIEVGRIAILPPRLTRNAGVDDCIGPKNSLAWSGDGTRLIAATDEGSGEFVIIDVGAAGTVLQLRHVLEACAKAWNMPNDILTTNGLRPPPTPTPTPSLTWTPVPTPTDAPSRMATPTQPAPSAMPTPSTTSTPTATETPAPTVTPTRPPSPIHLPLAIRERCVPGKRRVDLTLVIDASTTMRDDRTSTGRTKLDAAAEAARALVETLALPFDQGAVVTFSSDATLLVGLTGRRSEIEAALGRIAVGRQTRIDRGIAVAHEELTGPRRRASSAAVMVVLTDGLANPEPASTAVARAGEAKGDGITVFTIGLGRDADLDVAALEQMASRREYYYRAPDGEDLLAIYAAIAVEIPCPAEGYWGQK